MQLSELEGLTYEVAKDTLVWKAIIAPILIGYQIKKQEIVEE